MKKALMGLLLVLVGCVQVRPTGYEQSPPSQVKRQLHLRCVHTDSAKNRNRMAEPSVHLRRHGNTLNIYQYQRCKEV